MFHSYVKLPEGIAWLPDIPFNRSLVQERHGIAELQRPAVALCLRAAMSISLGMQGAQGGHQGTRGLEHELGTLGQNGQFKVGGSS